MAIFKQDGSLDQDGKEELAVALLLWKDFKTQDGIDPQITLQMIMLARYLGIDRELDKMMAQLPPMRIIPKGDDHGSQG